ncbi:MAG: hypothetical protein ABR536_03720 [Solirubrobacterales bacterium]
MARERPERVNYGEATLGEAKSEGAPLPDELLAAEDAGHDPETLGDEQRREDVEHLETELEIDQPLEDPDDPAADPAMAPVEEAGGGVSEGFEQSEQLLQQNAEGERDDDPLRNPFNSEPEEEPGPDAEYGEADQLPPEPDK